MTKFSRGISEIYCGKAGYVPFNVKIAVDKGDEVIGVLGTQCLLCSRPDRYGAPEIPATIARQI